MARGSFSDIYEINHFSLSQKVSQHFSHEKVKARANVIALECQKESQKLRREKTTARSNMRDFVYQDSDEWTIAESVSSIKIECDYDLKLDANGNKFVVKHIRPELVFSPRDFHIAATGLVRETEILSSLQHPNIVTLRGISAHGPAGYARGHHDGYFLVFDRLYETLEDKIKIWQKKQKQNRLQVIPIRIHGRYKNDLILQRLKVLTDISDALTYLHDKRIIHRDLKVSDIQCLYNTPYTFFLVGICCFFPSTLV